MEYPDRIESWRAVIGWPDYEVSDLGRVHSIDRWVTSRWGTRYWKPGKILTQSGSPYRHVRLYRDGEDAYLDVHVIELEAFAGPRPPGQVARHGPAGTRANWWPENLCWGTQAENLTLDRARDGTSVRGAQVFGARLTALIVVECRERRAAGEAVMALATEFGVGRSAMHRAVTGQTWRHLPQ